MTPWTWLCRHLFNTNSRGFLSRQRADGAVGCTAVSQQSSGKSDQQTKQFHQDCLRHFLSEHCEVVLTHKTTLNAIMEPLTPPPLQGDTNTAQSQHSVLVFHLYSRILEYVFLRCAISLIFSHRASVCFGVCCRVAWTVKAAVSRRRPQEKPGDSGVVHTGGGGGVCSVAVFLESLPVSHCPLSVFCCHWIGRCQCFVYFSIME